MSKEEERYTTREREKKRERQVKKQASRRSPTSEKTSTLFLTVSSVDKIGTCGRARGIFWREADRRRRRGRKTKGRFLRILFLLGCDRSQRIDLEAQRMVKTKQLQWYIIGFQRLAMASNRLSLSVSKGKCRRENEKFAPSENPIDTTDTHSP